MKKIYIYLSIILLLTSLSPANVKGQNGEKWSFDKLDTVLTELLYISYNDPFLTPTIRQDYLHLAIKRVSSVLGLTPYNLTAIMAQGATISGGLPKNTTKIHAVQRYAGTSNIYSLIEIPPSDVGQGELNTSVPAQYYYWFPAYDPTYEWLAIYPPNDADSVILTVYGEKVDTTFANNRHIANDIILHYALVKCYSQKGEPELAEQAKNIGEMLLFDLKYILEDRSIDITLGKKVLTK